VVDDRQRPEALPFTGTIAVFTEKMPRGSYAPKIEAGAEEPLLEVCIGYKPRRGGRFWCERFTPRRLREFPRPVPGAAGNDRVRVCALNRPKDPFQKVHGTPITGNPESVRRGEGVTFKEDNVKAATALAGDCRSPMHRGEKVEYIVVLPDHRRKSAGARAEGKES